MTKRFSKEFKKHVVSLVTKEGQSINSVARNLDIGKSTLGKWVSLSKTEGQDFEPTKTLDETEELKRLRKEVKLLRQERETLKKAAAFFAKEQP